MITVTPEEISQFRSQLVDSPEALAALDDIEESKGNLEAAAQLIAVKTTDTEVSFRGDSNYPSSVTLRKHLPFLNSRAFV